MEKKVMTAFGKKIYLLGEDKDGIRHWLEEPSWDCGWYWGFGYVETYTNNKRPDLSRDISSHSHFDGMFMGVGKCPHDEFKRFFEKIPLSDEEIWMLCDYMESFYTLRSAAETLEYGYSYQTEKAKVEALKDEAVSKKINEAMLPALFDEIRRLLSPEEAL